METIQSIVAHSCYGPHDFPRTDLIPGYIKFEALVFKYRAVPDTNRSITQEGDLKCMNESCGSVISACNPS